MDIILKDNVKFISVENKTKLRTLILNFISESKTDKILYKGDPKFIDYKLLKKILPLEQIKFNEDEKSLNKFVDISTEDDIRVVYNELLDKIDCDFCVIHKF